MNRLPWRFVLLAQGLVVCARCAASAFHDADHNRKRDVEAAVTALSAATTLEIPFTAPLEGASQLTTHQLRKMRDVIRLAATCVSQLNVPTTTVAL